MLDAELAEIFQYARRRCFDRWAKSAAGRMMGLLADWMRLLGVGLAGGFEARDEGGDPAWSTAYDDQDGYGDGEQPGDEVGRDGGSPCGRLLDRGGEFAFEGLDVGAGGGVCDVGFRLLDHRLSESGELAFGGVSVGIHFSRRGCAILRAVDSAALSQGFSYGLFVEGVGDQPSQIVVILDEAFEGLAVTRRLTLRGQAGASSRRGQVASASPF